MRTNYPKQQHHVKVSRWDCVYCVPPGVELPDDLILVHEARGTYSLQARESMTVDELNGKITDFLARNGELLSKEEWRTKYPRATELAYVPSRHPSFVRLKLKDRIQEVF
ncbi:hypothetical protein BJX99DRAFT_237319 [Aspergillus californicus]